jgi:hypothetical protein
MLLFIPRSRCALKTGCGQGRARPLQGHRRLASPKLLSRQDGLREHKTAKAP